MNEAEACVFLRSAADAFERLAVSAKEDSEHWAHLWNASDFRRCAAIIEKLQGDKQ